MNNDAKNLLYSILKDKFQKAKHHLNSSDVYDTIDEIEKHFDLTFKISNKISYNNVIPDELISDAQKSIDDFRQKVQNESNIILESVLSDYYKILENNDKLFKLFQDIQENNTKIETRLIELENKSASDDDNIKELQKQSIIDSDIIKSLENRIETIEKYYYNTLHNDMIFFKNTLGDLKAESDELRASDNLQHEKLFKHISALLKFIQTEKKRIDLIDARIDDLSDSVCTKFSELNERISDKSESMKNQYDIYKQYADNAIDVFGAEIEKLKKDIKEINSELQLCYAGFGSGDVRLNDKIESLVNITNLHSAENLQLKQDFAILLHTNFVEKIDALSIDIKSLQNNSNIHHAGIDIIKREIAEIKNNIEIYQIEYR